MPRPRYHIPSYLKHSSGQARVVIPLPGGGRKQFLLGPYGSPESKAEYERVLANCGPTRPGFRPAVLPP